MPSLLKSRRLDPRVSIWYVCCATDEREHITQDILLRRMVKRKLVNLEKCSIDVYTSVRIWMCVRMCCISGGHVGWLSFGGDRLCAFFYGGGWKISRVRLVSMWYDVDIYSGDDMRLCINVYEWMWIFHLRWDWQIRILKEELRCAALGVVCWLSVCAIRCQPKRTKTDKKSFFHDNFKRL